MLLVLDGLCKRVSNEIGLDTKVVDNFFSNRTCQSCASRLSTNIIRLTRHARLGDWCADFVRALIVAFYRRFMLLDIAWTKTKRVFTHFSALNRLDQGHFRGASI